MGEMSMRAGEAMSMWTRTSGQTWPGFAASFLWMWITMMAPMMILLLAVTVWRCRRIKATPTWRDGLRLALHCARGCAPLMAIAMVVGSQKIHLLAIAVSALRSLSLTSDRSRHILLSNVKESAACTPMPTSCKERSICSS